MKTHRGMSSLLFLLAVGGLLLLFGWFLYGGQKPIRSITEDPNGFTEDIIQIQTDGGITKEVADYNMGITYSLISAAFIAQNLKREEGTYTNLCKNGKVNFDNPEVLNGIRPIHCVAGSECDGDSFLLRSESEQRCYASKDGYAVSANTYKAGGVRMPQCYDTTFDETTNEPKIGVANQTTVRCEAQ